MCILRGEKGSAFFSQVQLKKGGKIEGERTDCWSLE